MTLGNINQNIKTVEDKVNKEVNKDINIIERLLLNLEKYIFLLII